MTELEYFNLCLKYLQIGVLDREQVRDVLTTTFPEEQKLAFPPQIVYEIGEALLCTIGGHTKIVEKEGGYKVIFDRDGFVNALMGGNAVVGTAIEMAGAAMHPKSILKVGGIAVPKPGRDDRPPRAARRKATFKRR